jgi:hypothetical protein
MCSKLNPDTLEVCQFCGARLKPFVLPATSALNLPSDWEKAVEAKSQEKKSPETKSSASSTDDWLSSLRGGAGPSEAASESDDTLGPANPVDDWLAKLRAQDESDNVAETPAGSQQSAENDWLGSLRSPSSELPSWLDETPATEPAPEPPEPQSSWMDSLRGSADETLVARPKSQPEPSLPSWLDSGTAEPEQPAEPTLPDWMSDSQPAEPAQPSLPDWLSPSAADETIISRPTATTPPPAAGPSTSTLPDWLSPQPSEPSVPDWLSSSSASPDETIAAPPPTNLPDWMKATTEPASDLPDWLSGSDQRLDETIAAPPPSAGQPARYSSSPAEPPAQEPSASLPDWLSDGTPAPEPAPQADLPDWLTGGQPADSGAPAVDQSLPDWMSASPEPATTASTENVSLPDWLSPAPTMPESKAAPGEPKAVEGITDWLASGGTDTLPGAGTVDNKPMSTTGWLRSVTPSGTDSLDWLGKPGAEPPAPAAKPSAPPSIPEKKLEPSEPKAPVEGITDWLASGGTDTLPGAGTTDNKPMSTTGWLRSVTPSGTDSLDWLGEPGTPEPPTKPAVPPASIPEKKLEPSGSKSADGITDWLASGGTDTLPGSTADNKPLSTTGWLRSVTPSGTDSLEWLGQPGAEPAVEQPPAKPAAPPTSVPPKKLEPSEPKAVEGITDWLASGGTDTLPGAGTADNRPLSTTGWLRSVTPSGTDSLDWLGKPGAEPPAPAAKPSAPPSIPEKKIEPSEPKAVEGITDWLASGGTDQLPGSTADNKPLSITGWLRSMTPSGTGTDSLDWLGKKQSASQAKSDPKAVVGSTDWLNEQSGGQAGATTPANEMPDWLKGSAPAGSNASVGGVTDWLSSNESQPPAPESAPGDKAVLGTTDWLNAIGIGQPPETPTTTPVPAAAAPKKPKTGWLTGPLKAPAEEPVQPPPSAPASSKAVLGATEWLDALAASAMAKPPAPSAPKGAEIPDWLAQSESGQPAESASVPDWISTNSPDQTAPSGLTSDTSKTVVGTTDWLKSVTTPDKNAPFVETGVLKEIRKNDVSDLDWLTALQPSSPSASPTARSTGLLKKGTGALASSAEPSPASGELPSWLAALKPADLELSATDPDATLVSSLSTASAEEAAQTPAVAAEELPEWIRPIASTTGSSDETMVARPGRASSSTPSVPAFSTPIPTESEDLAVANLPAWMRALRPLDARATAREPEPDHEETTGPLAGMRGILPAESVISMAGQPGAAVAGFVLTDAHTKLAERLRRLVQEEATEEVDVKPHKKGGLNFDIWRMAVAIVLMFVVLIPMVLQLPPELRLFATPNISHTTRGFHDAVENLTPGQVVLVAVEYEPAYTGELNPAVESVLVHLLQHGMRVVTVSTSPMGAGIADELLVAAATEAGGKEPDKDYRNLGFIPGGPVGIRQFALNPVATIPDDFAGKDQPFEFLADFTGIQDPAMVVVASATADSAQNWIQQAPGIKSLTIISSAAAEPLLVPYTQGNPAQVKALLSGLSSALQYNDLSGRSSPEVERVANRWTSYGYGLYTIAGLLTLGSLVGVAVVLVNRRPKKAKKGAKAKTRPVTRAAAPAPVAEPEPVPTETLPEFEPSAEESAPTPTNGSKPSGKAATKAKSAKTSSAKKTTKGKATSSAKAKPKPKQKSLETRTAKQPAPETETADRPARPRMRKV